MIKTFADKLIAAVFAGHPVLHLPPEIQRRAREKLRMIHAARAIDDLHSPPSNRLEKLAGNRAGQWSIRINDQWRICFTWQDGDACDVEIIDYHR